MNDTVGKDPSEDRESWREPQAGGRGSSWEPSTAGGSGGQGPHRPLLTGWRFSLRGSSGSCWRVWLVRRAWSMWVKRRSGR